MLSAVARAKTVYPALALLVQSAARDEKVNQTELARRTGFGRSPIGDVWHGRVARVHPDVAKAVCEELGIPIRRFLRAAGYDINEGAPQIPKGMEELAELWPDLPDRVRQGLLIVAQGAARTTSQTDGEAA